jgi:hypothetical protein
MINNKDNIMQVTDILTIMCIFIAIIPLLIAASEVFLSGLWYIGYYFRKFTGLDK